MAGLALLLLALASPAQALPTSPVLLTVENQGGAALLEWQLVPLGPPPAVDLWVVSKWRDDGQFTQIYLPGTQFSYVDGDVLPGHTYVYTVSYIEQGVQGLPSNPVVFSDPCFLFLKCFPLRKLPFDPECLFLC